MSFLTLGAFVLGTSHADTRVTKWHFTPLVLLGSCIMPLGYEGSREVTDFDQPLAAEVWPTPFAFTRVSLLNETADVFMNKKKLILTNRHPYATDKAHLCSRSVLR